MKKKLSLILSMLSIMFGLSSPVDMPQAEAKIQNTVQGTILFVPHDNRPTSCEQSTEALELAGYNVIMPPKDMLGGLRNTADTNELWGWVNKNISKADIAVVSTDSLIYGGLVASRNHNNSEEVLLYRTNKFKQLKKSNKKLKIFAFGSLMRTPKNGAAAGAEEPEYYQKYGDKIFRVSALNDQKETRKLTKLEKEEREGLMNSIPSGVYKDYFGRRTKNINVTKNLMNLAQNGILNFLVIGKDDNAPFCATHQEAQELNNFAKKQGLSRDKFMVATGIDEFAMLLLARATNTIENKQYTVNVQYNTGVGKDTIPKFSDEKLFKSIRDELTMAGAKETNKPNADLFLLVNTDPKGRTTDGYPEENDPDPMYNDGKPRIGTQYFLDMVKENIAKKRSVALADVCFANGSDKALMNLLSDNKLLFRLRSYSGWNTPTNSTGFALGQGLVNLKNSQEDCNRMLVKRYLDDWGYQANAREKLMWSLPDSKYYFNLAEYEKYAEDLVTKELREFAAWHLSEYPNATDIKVTFPWHITFIGGITINENIPKKKLIFNGRWNIENNQATCGNGATYVTARFTGTSIAAKMDDRNCWWRYEIDGKPYNRIKFRNELTTLAENLPKGEHKIKLVRSTEGEAGLSTFKGFVLDEGAEILSPDEPKRLKLEFVGDSITAGAFNDGPHDVLSYHDVENNDMSYGPQLARMLDADYSVLAKSGEGLVHNYSEEWPYNQVHTADRYPWTYYSFNWNDHHLNWDFSNNKTDAVFISIGANDFLFEPRPTEDEFIKEYIHLIKVVRKNNPTAAIICLEPVPTVIGPDAASWTEIAVTKLKNNGDKDLYYIPLNKDTPLLNDSDYVGDGVHPTQEGSRKIAEYLKNKVETILKSKFAKLPGY